jgi:DNA (cytosine-5)-methyltransferase 3A
MTERFANVETMVEFGGMIMAELKPLKVLSLFDGISCGMVALERAGIPVEKYVAYEIEPNAIKISKKNYPQIEQCGDVFKADFTQYEGFDLVIGGSPCTLWSAARLNTGKNGTVERETEPKGFGYELFMQFVRAVNETEAKYFLYENNFSISQNIKDEITKQLGVKPVMINSGLVSAQNRKRMYWTNIPNVEIPADRKINLCDVVDFSNYEFREVGKWCFELWGGKPKIEGLKTIYSEKSHTLTTSKTHPMNYYLNKEKNKYCNLSVQDWEKLQTLPKGYVDMANVPEGAKYKAIGNGWTVDVIAHIFKGLKGE